MSVERECILILAGALARHLNPDIKHAAADVLAKLMPLEPNLGYAPSTPLPVGHEFTLDGVDYVVTTSSVGGYRFTAKRAEPKHDLVQEVSVYRDLLVRASAQLGESSLAQQIDRALARKSYVSL